MGKCCNTIKILLDPWDIEGMARHLGVSGRYFLETHCLVESGAQSGWPAVWLKGAASGPCEFLVDGEKCGVYPARPTICRTYPLGRAVGIESDGSVVEKVFLVEKADFCLGHKADRRRTVADWLNDEGVSVRTDAADQYLQLIHYAQSQLNSGAWMSKPVVNMLNPFLFAPDLLRSKLGITEDIVDHAEFYRRRLTAVKLILTDIAAGFGFGPAAGSQNAQYNESLMDRAKRILLGQ